MKFQPVEVTRQLWWQTVILAVRLRQLCHLSVRPIESHCRSAIKKAPSYATTEASPLPVALLAATVLAVAGSFPGTTPEAAGRPAVRKLDRQAVGSACGLRPPPASQGQADP
jgi:hypothetical protein